MPGTPAPESRAHLDPENPAASRPPDALASTVRDLRRSGLVEDGSRVLDLGCGPGLAATLLAAEGCRVTGVDLSRRSVECARAEARRRGQQIGYRVQDFRHLTERPYRHALLTTSHSYPDGVWCNQYTVVDDDGATTYRMWFTDHTPTTAATVLGRAGLRLLRCTDGLSARPWTGSGSWLGVVAEPS